MGIIRNIRERVNLFLYNNKTIVLQSLKYISLIISVAAAALTIYFYGFEQSPGEEETLISYFKGMFGYYIFSYFVRIIYSFDIRKFLKSTWIEGVMLLFMLGDAVGFYLFDTRLFYTVIEGIGLDNPRDVYVAVLQIYLFGLIALEVGKSNVDLSRLRLNPGLLFVIIFGGIILVGAGLLMLPEMTVARYDAEGNRVYFGFIDALFTSASATCVTGLMVENTHTFFTFKGQVVLLGLIKIGGLNIVAFGMFFAIASRFGIRVKQHEIIEDIVNKSTFHSAQGLFGKIFLISTGIEIVGAILLFFMLPTTSEIEAIWDRVFYSLFHSVSAFNNAGISLYEAGLGKAELAASYDVLCVMSVLIFAGALGFVTILDVLDLKAFKERLKKPWKKFDIGTRVGLASNTHLLLFGTLFFIILEWSTASFTDHPSIVGKVVTAIFQTVNRTAGFNSVDIGQLGVPMVIVFLLLMFIGGSSSSTAGGIKTSTFTLLFVSVYTTIRGKKNAELYKKNISSDLLIKAYAVLLFTMVNLFLWIFLLTITESEALESGKMTLIDMVFEEFSAFSTVGLSRGITAEFSDLGKLILTASMFIGRLGTLMLVMALSKQAVSTRYKYPDAHIMIG